MADANPPSGFPREDDIHDRWLVTGAHGMLGRDLVAVLMAQGLSVTATDREHVDITDLAATRAAVRGHVAVVNTAAWTDVDAAETNEAAATLINGTGTANLAVACAEAGIPLLHLSTDYVLPGDADKPYPEAAQPSPINAYGRSKLVGERAVLSSLPDRGYVVRTAWLYGEHGPNFVRTMLRLASERERLEVVNDQRGQPTWSYALAEQLVALGRAALAGTAPAGVYHGTASGETTWYEFARAIFAEAGLDPERVQPTSSDRYRRPARRPAYSVLGHDRWALAGLPPQPEWRTMLANAFPSMRRGEGNR
jgi:dTDP-4-dehydrorhamnose reductase